MHASSSSPSHGTSNLSFPAPEPLPLAKLPLLDAPDPSLASCSRKLLHSSAKLSLLLSALTLPLLLSLISSSVFSDGVLGVRRKGDRVRRRLPVEAPGRARPAASRCSGCRVSSSHSSCAVKSIHDILRHRTYHHSSLTRPLSTARPETSSDPTGQAPGSAEGGW